MKIEKKKILLEELNKVKICDSTKRKFEEELAEMVEQVEMPGVEFGKVARALIKLVCDKYGCGYKIRANARVLSKLRRQFGIYPVLDPAENLPSQVRLVARLAGWSDEQITEVEKKALEILRKVKEKNKNMKRSPLVVGAAAICIAAILTSNRVTQSLIAEALGITEYTLRGAKNDIIDILGLEIL